MSWLRLDDGFDDHPKLVELGAADSWRWVRVLLYCSRKETDGLVSGAALARLGVTTRLRVRFLELGLLEPEELGTGFLVHNFLEFNPSREERDRERARWREYKRESRGSEAGSGDRAIVHGGHSRDSRVESALPSRGSLTAPFPYPYPNSKPGRGNPREAGGDVGWSAEDVEAVNIALELRRSLEEAAEIAAMHAGEDG